MKVDLTQREQEICDRLLKGMMPKEIAPDLNISKETVLFHQKNIYRKYDVHKINQLIAKCQQELSIGTKSEQTIENAENHKKKFRGLSKLFFVMAVIGCFFPLLFNLNCFQIIYSVTKGAYDRNFSSMFLVLILYLCSTLAGTVTGIPVMIKKISIMIDWLFLTINIICGLTLYRYIIFQNKVRYIDRCNIEEYEIQIGIKIILACLSISFIMLFFASLHIDNNTIIKLKRINQKHYCFLFILGLLFFILRPVCFSPFFLPFFSPLSLFYARIIPIVYFSVLFGSLAGFAVGLIIPSIDVVISNIIFSRLPVGWHGYMFILFSSIFWSIYGYILGFIWNYIKKYSNRSITKNFYLFFLIFFVVDIFRCFFTYNLFNYVYYSVSNLGDWDYYRIPIIDSIPHTILMVLLGTPFVIITGLWQKKANKT